ncbi:hypothetical protein RN001_015345 [Aquatica leii]|uniref:Uncharacterized protein n=1 Tax=Aquatica leii TaxID=1421715 RepID=A0AAN7S6L8_9COLE|nr:hypothetical protein RN001_015345 [Aquatica leii]
MYGVFLILIASVFAQDNIESICRICGDVVNEYCCQYYNSCCDFINPTGCPPPTSPETRKACQNPIRCTSTSQCSSPKQCCRTTVCGSTCIESIFDGYKY